MADENGSGNDEVDQDIEDLLADMDGSPNDASPETAPKPAPDTEAAAAPEPTAEPVAALEETAPIEMSPVLSGESVPVKRVKIIIGGGQENESQDVFLSVNGKAFQMQRGVPITVPDYVLEVLDNAVQSRLVQVKEGIMDLRDSPRFSYQIVRD